MRMRPQFIAILTLANRLTYEGIAADLNISIGTVKSRLSRARSYLARLIEDDRRGSTLKEGIDASQSS